MTHREEAKRTALAYAWGREDESKRQGNPVPTVTPEGAISGDLAFAEAYAKGQDDYNGQRRGDMESVQAAYDHWQDSGGRSVFKRGELTLSDDERGELRRLWPDPWFDGDKEAAYAAYWDRRQRMQDAAWAALGTS